MTSRALTRPKKATTDPDAIKANTAHNFVTEQGLRTIKIMVLCGAILFRKKQSLPHGKWLPWVRKNLNFSIRTAQYYLLLYEQRDKILQAPAQSLAGAIAILSDTKRVTPGLLSADEKVLRRSLVTPLKVVRRRLHRLPRDPLYFDIITDILSELSDEITKLKDDLGI